MTSIAMIGLFTILFVLVDDWYKGEGIKLLKGKAGSKPEFTDSEVITRMLVRFPRLKRATLTCPLIKKCLPYLAK